jgi:hypothetical protein
MGGSRAGVGAAIGGASRGAVVGTGCATSAGLVRDAGAGIDTSTTQPMAAPTTIGNVVRNNTIVMGRLDGVALEWAQYGQSGRMFDVDARNSGASNRFWYPAAEDGNPRFAWQGLRPNLADFNSTPGGKDGRYLSTAERDQLLAASNVPL